MDKINRIRTYEFFSDLRIIPKNLAVPAKTVPLRIHGVVPGSKFITALQFIVALQYPVTDQFIVPS